MGMGGDRKIAMRAVIAAAPELVRAWLDIAQESEAAVGEEIGPFCRARLDRAVAVPPGLGAACGDHAEKAAAKIRRGRRPPPAHPDKAAGGGEERGGPALPVRRIEDYREGIIRIALARRAAAAIEHSSPGVGHADDDAMKARAEGAARQHTFRGGGHQHFEYEAMIVAGLLAAEP